MTIYGLFTLCHHGGLRVLTVMSAQGAKAALEQVTLTADVVCKPQPGYLTQYWARRKGAFEDFIETNDIVLLDTPQWAQKKTELGEHIF